MQVYGLVGNPVGHSLSPPMHEAGYEALDVDASYVTFEPAPDDIGDAIAGANALGIAGLNVTIPFKQDVLELVEPDDLARRIGAVNTIDFSGDRPTGHNTDATGARRAFEHHDVDLAGTTAVVVGAGGAGRAISFMLAEEAETVHVVNRTAATAHELAADVEAAGTAGTDSTLADCHGHGLDALPGLLAGADVLVNATSVGMDEPDDTPVPADSLHSSLVVMDAVYSPLETRLLREAGEAGATTIDGAWMLLFQGVDAFERWLDQPAPVDAMNSALRSRI